MRIYIPRLRVSFLCRHSGPLQIRADIKVREALIVTIGTFAMNIALGTIIMNFIMIIFAMCIIVVVMAITQAAKTPHQKHAFVTKTSRPLSHVNRPE